MIDENSAVETDADAIRKALDLIFHYGAIDGDWHKQWVLDQVVRALVQAPLHDGDYASWVAAYRDGADGPETYEWDEGIPP